jgi:hypothetical protein
MAGGPNWHAIVGATEEAADGGEDTDAFAAELSEDVQRSEVPWDSSDWQYQE